jgi:putative FmdB family regulatory protein
MPTYRYECTKCGKVHEIFQSINAGRSRKCPDCGGKLERLIGRGGGVLLKGSGFYTTEYRSDSYKKAEKKERDAAKSGSDAGSGGAKKESGGKPSGTKKDGAKKGGAKKAKGDA